MVPAISADMEWSLRLTTLPGPTIFILFKLYNVMLDGERETCRNATQNLERGNAECEEKIDERGHLKREGILETRAHFCLYVIKSEDWPIANLFLNSGLSNCFPHKIRFCQEIVRRNSCKFRDKYLFNIVEFFSRNTVHKIVIFIFLSQP